MTRLLLAVAATIAAVGAAADQEPKMAITAPRADTVISGTTAITLDIVPTAAVQVVNFFVDGRLACTVERPPFACTWEPGAVVRGHHIRVVATFSGGRRLVDNVRTKDLGYAERTEVEAVLVPVIVTEDGRFVRGLRKRDFEVFEDGTPQQVLALASEESPLDLVLAIDISGSMEGALAEVKSAVKLLLAQLRAGDAATLIGFNDNTFLVAEREKDQQAREAAVDLLSAWGVGRHALVLDIVWNTNSGDQRCRESRHRRRGLEPVTSLAGKPEKPVHPGIKSDHRRLVRGEGAQPGPFVLDTPDFEGCQSGETVDRDGDVHLLGLRINRCARRFICRRDQQLAGIRFEIDILAGPDGQRP
jgi:hypothetical protein